MANFIVRYENSAFNTEWEYIHNGNTVMVTTDTGNTWTYFETNGGELISQTIQVSESDLISALETLIGEDVTFDTSSTGLKPES